MANKINIFWFRRDLRLEDNHALYHALKGDFPVIPIFIFDSEILNELPKNDPRVTFICENLVFINKTLYDSNGSGIRIYYGKPLEIFKELVKKESIQTVFTNHDYEPYAIARDTEINSYLSKNGIQFKTFKDHVIFEKGEVLKSDGNPYLVYTPYMKQWKTNFRKTSLIFYASEKHLNNTLPVANEINFSIESIGFSKSNQKVEKYDLSPDVISNYHTTRDYPYKNATSKLGPHLRFGTVSIRKVVDKAIYEENETFWQELIWREFFIQILWHFPYSAYKSFKLKYDRIIWRNDKEEFKLWCEGQTGYPIVDAGMRELNATGFMHNRVRMIVSSFLCKHLLIDWRWGEAYFAEKLHDYEMASNVGNWQWAAGCGVDAAPYFRIFNPTTQVERFDKNLDYIKKWVPEFQELTYSLPIIDHKVARLRCLEVYQTALSD